VASDEFLFSEVPSIVPPGTHESVGYRCSGPPKKTHCPRLGRAIPLFGVAGFIYNGVLTIARERIFMKAGIHPEYKETTVTCGCGNKFVTRSTRKNITVEICSVCHPFFTGKMKYVDTTGRVEKFQRKYNWDQRKKQAAETPAAN
jgi:large subunit ribosomal protein L31